MEIQGLGSSIFPLKDRIQIGERVLVEVLNREGRGKAQLRFAGQEIKALLEFSAEAGDKFWAVVKKNDEKGILLVREKGVDSVNLSFRSEQSVAQGLTQAFALHPDGSKSSQWTSQQGLLQNSLQDFVKELIPQWSTLFQEEGGKAIATLIKRLGLDYERRVQNLLSLSPNLQGEERTELSQTLKGMLLHHLDEKTDRGDFKALKVLLDSLTTEQYLLSNKVSENPFYRFEFPIQHEGRLYIQRLAVKGARKGNRMDLGHCRLAIHACTPTFGEIGLEGWLYEGQLSLKVFSHNPAELRTFVEEHQLHLQEQLSRLGIGLYSLGVVPMTEAEDFHRFLRGEHQEGVDYRA